MTNDLWYALPLVVTVSLVYSATRHEQPASIVRHAFGGAVWITALMSAILGVLWLIQ